MAQVLTRNWGWVAMRGVLAIAFGMLTLLYPGITLVALVLLFGAYAVADGSFMVVSAIANRHGEPRWMALLLGGMLGIAAGLAAFLWPGITALSLLTVMAAWAIVTGIAEIVAAIKLRREIANEWMLILAGALTLAFGVLLILRPGAGALAMVFWIGIYAIFAGVLLIALSLKLRRWGRPHPA